ncbi:hypothetical protein ACLMJK_006276 [Lecanora helva]
MREPPNSFVFLFLFRYIRTVGHIIGNYIYTPVPINNKTVAPSAEDVTVIVPTVDPLAPTFSACINSILAARPAFVFIVTASRVSDGDANFERLKRDWQNVPSVQLLECPVMNKRRQLCTALPKPKTFPNPVTIEINASLSLPLSLFPIAPIQTSNHELQVTTPITIFTDDHIFYPPTLFPSLLAPFSPPHGSRVGLVGTSINAKRTIPTFPLSLASLTNLLGALYLHRNNHHHRATSALDGGVYVISGRTSAHRTTVVQDPMFLEAFQNEYVSVGPWSWGPMNADDDNFITRWNVEHGWEVRYQDVEGLKVVTTIGDDGVGGFQKFVKQNLRWTRTRWRSTARSLFGCERGKGSKTQPWCAYAVKLSWLVSFALLYDAALLRTCYLALRQWHSEEPIMRFFGMLALIIWILGSKIVKTYGYFEERPDDLIYLPACIVFGYFHSFIKLYALLTFWDVEWGSRPLEDEDMERVDEEQSFDDCGSGEEEVLRDAYGGRQSLARQSPSCRLNEQEMAEVQRDAYGGFLSFVRKHLREMRGLPYTGK